MTELRQRAVREDAPPEDKVEASLSAAGSGGGVRVPAASPSDLCRGLRHQAWAAQRVGRRPPLVGTAACELGAGGCPRLP